ncbi:hypothetical protein HPB50_013198 [Hyalomma asiaticum]|uniref:Uncharacterized protein n=1 Tax=Hyalomma asiaticum TaxID=266040 RepID=A0ACB7TNG3_HYAAI|nr:hypothetical protein HPB50_013198 [Hyalomma asiaticum]
MPCIYTINESTMSNAINEQPELVDSVLEGGDDVAEQSKDDGAQSLRIPEAVSNSDDGPESVNVSLDTTTGHSDEARIGSAMCRICHDGDEEEPLVSPCKCSGSIRFVHVSCIEHWLNEMNVDICELCGQRFQMAAQPNIAKQFLHWISLREAQLQRALLRDVLVWAMMTVGTLIALAIMLQVAFSEASQRDSVLRTFILSVLAFIKCALIGFGTATIRRLRGVLRLFRAWKASHPFRRILAASTARAGPPGRAQRNDVQEAAGRAAFARRRRR